MDQLNERRKVEKDYVHKVRICTVALFCLLPALVVQNLKFLNGIYKFF